jgi:proline iminopeptidase
MQHSSSGYLSADGHQIYWEDWGNPKAPLIMHLHGGPGSSFGAKHKLLYEPSQHRVIFHDQRGCGQSTPRGLLANNTVAALIADIDALRHQAGVEKITVAGGSWGSTLALLYAAAHPERVERLILWSVFLARKFEIDWVNEGYPRYTFPEAWERFISLVPASDRGNGESIMRFYATQVNGGDLERAKKYAAEWSLWEYSLTSLNYDQRRLESELAADEDTLHNTRIQLHYLQNKCFIPENYILDSIAKIRHIPCNVVHGRFDMCCPPFIAADLARAYGPKLRLQWVNSGHLRTEPEMLAALRATI